MPVVDNPPVVNNSILQVTTSRCAPTPINKTHSLYISTILTNDRTHTESLTLSALAVQQNDDDGSKTLSNIISPILALTFDGSDDSIDDVTLYAGNNQYQATGLLNIRKARAMLVILATQAIMIAQKSPSIENPFSLLMRQPNLNMMILFMWNGRSSITMTRPSMAI